MIRVFETLMNKYKTHIRKTFCSDYIILRHEKKLLAYCPQCLILCGDASQILYYNITISGHLFLFIKITFTDKESETVNATDFGVSYINWSTYHEVIHNHNLAVSINREQICYVKWSSLPSSVGVGCNMHLNIYTFTLCTSSVLTSTLKYVKILTGYGGSSSNGTQSSLFVY
jgi:hypothetical protein